MKYLAPFLVALMIACKQGGPPASASPASDDWQSDESRFISVKFPSSYTVSTFNMGDEVKVFPGLGLEPKSGSKPNNLGSLFVSHNSTYSGMLLRDGVSAGVKFLAEHGGKLVIPPHNIATKNGTCLGFMMADPQEDCPAEMKAGKCFPIAYVAHCETPFGKRFEGMGIAAIQTSNAKLEPGAIEMAKTFDKIMATLEFKKF